MRFHALLPVRDEADIIGQSLTHMLTWADAIHVFDTGSLDETWEVIRDMAASEKRIIPLGKDRVFFSDTCVRGWIFHQAQKHMRAGDWFLRVDADEFHAIPPPEFVKTRMGKHETVAWHQYYNFQLTESEAGAYAEGKDILADRKRPVEERRCWFIPSASSEPRLCQYRETMRWPPTVSFPFNSGYVARERLPIRHYPHRDPMQMERRCRLRAIMMADEQNRANWSQGDMHHWSEREWRRFVVPDDAPGLQYWRPGTALPEYHFTSHLAGLHKRAIQRFAHAVGLSVLDRFRQEWPEGTYPQRIPEDVAKELERQLAG
jgi:hypothetical protein